MHDQQEIEAILCMYKCAETNYPSWCVNWKPESKAWCDHEHGCPLWGYQNFYSMGECRLYMVGKLDKSLGCVYKCDKSAHTVHYCLEKSQVCTDGFYENYNLKSRSNGSTSWCHLADRGWYDSYSHCIASTTKVGVNNGTRRIRQ